MEPQFHLAQVNIARMRAPLDDPSMADFVARIDEINALAKASPGFIWRWTGEDNGPFSDSSILFNLSVWESLDALKEYVYRGPHVELFRDRQRWFLPSEGPSLALWWIPGDAPMPTPQDSKTRLDSLAAAGPTPVAFTFRAPCPPFHVGT